MALISPLYRDMFKPKATVNCRRINRERRRIKLAAASFIPTPRLVTPAGFKYPQQISK